MSQVFISYRKSDGGVYPAIHVDERLCALLGPEQVFRASRSIAPGDDYAKVITRALEECETLVVIIGPGWHIPAETDSGQDWVRLEVATAISRGLRIIPVLLIGATPPSRASLPADVAALADRHYLRLGHHSFETDMANLLAAVSRDA